jgi:predicted MFS family arabinose efflux permease
MLVQRLKAMPTYQRALALYMIHALIMSTLTVNGLQIALPTIMTEFDVKVTTAVWIAIAYFVALGGGTMTLGGITTLFERRQLIVLGLVGDIVVMMITFFTHDIYVFIVCRFLSAAFRVFPWLILQVEGIGGFPPEKRGQAVGISTISMGLALLLSLPVTGFFVDHIGWRYLFVTASVLYVAMIPVIYLTLPKMKPDPATRRPLSEFDFLGAGLMMVGTIALITGMQMFARGLSDGLLVAVLAIGAVVALTSFVWVELHAKAPVLEFKLFRDPNVFLASTQSIIMGFMNGSLLLMLPFLFINGYGWTAAYASNLLLFHNITRPVAGPLAGKYSDRFGSAAVILPAAVLSLIGQVILAHLGVSPLLGILMAALVLWGTGQALMQTANLRQIYAALPRSHLHLAPSLNLVVMQFGNTSGQAVGSLVIEDARSSAVSAAGYVTMVNDAIILISIVFIVGMLVTQVLPRIVLRGRMQPMEAEALSAGEAG